MSHLRRLMLLFELFTYVITVGYVCYFILFLQWTGITFIFKLNINVVSPHQLLGNHGLAPKSPKSFRFRFMLNYSVFFFIRIRSIRFRSIKVFLFPYYFLLHFLQCPADALNVSDVKLHPRQNHSRVGSRANPFICKVADVY